MRKFFILFFLILIIFIATIPSILSTAWGTKQLTLWINHKIPGELQIGNLDLNWFSGQSVQNIKWHEDQYNAYINLSHIATQDPLWKLIYHSGHPQTLELNDLTLLAENIPTELIDQKLQNNQALPVTLTELLGPTINIHTKYRVEYQEPWLLLFESAHARGALQGVITKDKIGLAGQSLIEITLKPEILFRLLSIETSQDAHLKLNLNDLSVPLANWSSCSPSIKGQITLDPINIVYPSIGKLSDVTAKAEFDGPVCQESIQFKLLASATKDQKPVKILLDGTQSKKALLNRQIDLEANIREIITPVHLFPLTLDRAAISLKSQENHLLNIKIFTEINLKKSTQFAYLAPFKLNLETALPLFKNKKILPKVDVDLHYPGLHALFVITMEKGPAFHISLSGETSGQSKPGTFKGSAEILTSPSYEPIQMETTLHAARIPVPLLSQLFNQADLSPLFGHAVDLELKASIDRFFNEPGYIDLFMDSTELHSRARIKFEDKISLYESNKPTAEIRWDVSPSAYEFLKAWQPRFSLPQHSLAQTATLTLSLLKLDIPIQNSQVIFENGTLEAQASLAPIEWKNISQGQLLSFQSHLSSKKLTKEYELSAQLNLNETTLATFSTACLYDKGNLKLLMPLKADFMITPVSHAIFAKLNLPLMKELQRSEKPIHLLIEPEGFNLPIRPLDLSKLTFNQASLELGKLWVANKEGVQSLLNLIQSIKTKELMIWFTPIYFDVKNGDIAIKRFDFLVANLYSLACWGNYSLVKQQGDMVLGVQAKTLLKVFNVPLDEKEMVQIPLRLRKGNVEVDNKRLAAKISSLVAQKQAGKKLKWLDNTLNTVFSNGEEEAVPPPTTNPLPW